MTGRCWIGAAALAVMTGLAAWLRLDPIAAMPLWADEIHTWAVASYTDWGRLMTWHMPELGQLPLGFALPKAAMAITGSDANWVIRLPSAICGTLCVPAAFGLGRAAGTPALGLLAAALVVVDPSLVNESQNARMYALLSLLTLLTMWAVTLAHARPARWRWWLLAGVGLAATLWTHFTAVALWLGVAATAFAAAPADRGRVRRGLVVALAVACVLAFPGLPQLFQAAGVTAEPNPVSLAAKLGEIAANTSLLVHSLPLAIAVIPAATVGLALLGRRHRAAATLLGVTAAACWLLMVPLRDRHWFLEPRYLVTLQPAVWLGLAATATYPAARWLRYVAATGLIALWGAQWHQVHHFASWWRWPDKHQVLVATDVYGREAAAREVVVYDPGWLWRVAAEYRHLPFFAPLQAALEGDADTPLADTLPAGMPRPQAIWLIATMLDDDSDLARARRHVARLAEYFEIPFDRAQLGATLQRHHLLLVRVGADGISPRGFPPWSER